MKIYNIINNLEGWCSQEKIEKLYDHVISSKPKHLVEIGVFGGKSLLAIAFALKENRFGKIHGIDPWKASECIVGMKEIVAIDWWNSLDYEKIYRRCVSEISDNGLSEYVELHRMTSEEYSRQIDYEIDMLHIDGNHEEENSYRDVELYLPKVKTGGYVWFDDANWYQTKKALNLLESDYNCKLMDKAMSDDKHNWCNIYIKL
jgi:predicted O-methyltransferase YrrM